MTPTQRHERILKDLDRLRKDVLDAIPFGQSLAQKVELQRTAKSLDRVRSECRLLVFSIQDVEQPVEASKATAT